MNAQIEGLHKPGSQRPTILVIDDTKEVLTLIGHALQDHFHVRFALGGARGLEIAQGSPAPEALKLALDRAESAHGALRKTYFGMLRSFSELAELRNG